METPETNKAERMAYAGEYMVPTEFARRLERERDEAKAEASRIDGAYEDATNYYARIIELIEEHDAAREALKHIEEYGTEEINAAVELRQKLAQTLIERDKARELARQMSESNQALMADARFYRNAWEQLKEIAR